MSVPVSVNKHLTVLSVLLILPCFGLQAKTVGHVIQNIKKEKVKVPKSQRAKNNQLSSAGINLNEVRPATTSAYGSKPGTNEAQFEKYLDQQISQLYRLSKKTKSKSFRGEIWLRLAKSYTEKASLIERRINEDYDKALKDYLSGKVASKPRLNLAPAQAYNKKAIQLYKWYVKDHPRGSNTDQVIFFLGYNTMALGNDALGIKYYQKLAREYPNSEFMTETNLSLGDHYFDKAEAGRSNSKKHLMLAGKHYSKVINTKTRLAPIATYKMAWVYYKLGRPEKSLVYISRLVKDSKSNDERLSSAKRLAKEAQKELPIFYSQVGDYKKAVPYFKALMPESQVNSSIESLAMLYSDSGNREGAKYLLNYLAKNSNLSDEKLFEFAYKKVLLAESRGGTINLRDDIFDLIHQFGPRTQWSRKNKNKDFYQKAYEKMEFSLRNYALAVHKQAQARGDLQTMKRAESAYALYDKNFSKTDKDGEMRFFYAELLYDMKDYYKASELYKSVAKKKSRYAQKADLNALLSLEKMLPSLDDIKKKVGNSVKVYPLNKSEERFRDYAKDYLKDKSNKEQRVEVTYKLASMLYAHNYLDEAEQYFRQVNKEFPNSKYAEYSANLILDIYNLKKDYTGLEKAGLELLKSKTTSKEVAKDVKDVVEKSAFKRAEEIEKKGEPLKAAKAYLIFYKKYPKSVLASVALYNAAINFEKDNKKRFAIESYDRFRKVAKNSDPKKAESYLFSGILKESLGDFVGAVTDYKAYLNAVKPQDVDKDLYYNIAVIYEALSQFQNAETFFNVYIQNSSDPKRYNAYFRLAKFAEQLKIYANAIQNYKKFIGSPGIPQDLKVEAVGRLAQIYARANQKTNAKKYFDQSVALQRSTGSKENTKYAAEALFDESEGLYQKLRNIKISADPAKQQKEVQQKIQLVDSLRVASEKVIALDAPKWIVAALTRLGQAYQHLAYSIVSAPLPGDLSVDEKKEYMSQIEQVAKPFKDNAINSYKKAIEKAQSLGGFGEYYSIARAELYSLAPEKTYYAQEDSFVMEKYDTSMADDNVYKTLVRADVEEKNLSEALAKVLERDEKNLTAHEYMAYHHFQNERYYLARFFLNRLDDNYKKNPRILSNLGLIQMKLGEDSSAQEKFERALQIEPDHEAANINMTKKAIEKDGFVSVASNLEILYGKTRSRIRKGEKMAMDIAINHGVALARQGSFGGALEIYNRVLNSDRGNVSAARNSAIAVITGQKKKDKGAEVLQKYKSLASKKRDFDTIKVLEGVLAKL